MVVCDFKTQTLSHPLTSFIEECEITLANIEEAFERDDKKSLLSELEKLYKTLLKHQFNNLSNSLKTIIISFKSDGGNLNASLLKLSKDIENLRVYPLSTATHKV
jgi:hypothetical protein